MKDGPDPPAVAAFHVHSADREGALDLVAPREPGGTLAEAAQGLFAIGRGHAAVVPSMHQMQVSCQVAHAGGSVGQRRLLRRVASEGLLLGARPTLGAFA